MADDEEEVAFGDSVLDEMEEDAAADSAKGGVGGMYASAKDDGCTNDGDDVKKAEKEGASSAVDICAISCNDDRRRGTKWGIGGAPFVSTTRRNHTKH
jgi:hypothetical protein